jgi:hypothetical protein
VAQVQSSQKIESRFADVFYRQFENFMNVFFSRLKNSLDDTRKLKYTWRFRIFGDVFSDKDHKSELQQGLATGMSFLLPEYMSMFGQNLESSNTIMSYVSSMNTFQKMEVPVSAFNSKQGVDGKDSKNGRPSADLDNIENDNTASSIDQGTNLGETKTFTAFSPLPTINASSLFQGEEFQSAVMEILENYQEVTNEIIEKSKE